MDTETEYPYWKIDKKWQAQWDRRNANQTDIQQASKPFYNLVMFPYPSAEGLHVGNVFCFVGSDIQGRFHRMNGYDVFQPMGFDAFGLHSENFAIKQKDHPAQMTPRNIAYYKDKQLKKISNMYDWSHEIDTTSPDYYRWTQWLFLQLYKAGYAYRAKRSLNWCPSCNTVLADEQVVAGECERCDTAVTKKKLVQWFLKTTDFAQSLLDHLDWLDWPNATKAAQRNWIGRSEGASIVFQIPRVDQHVEVFTTRPDTIFGATFMVFAPEHPLLDSIVVPDKKADFDVYKKQTAQMTEIQRKTDRGEMTGVFSGAYAVNPANSEAVPIWISDYVLMEYGTGAVMAVPAHDQRDFEFAETYGLTIRQVISPYGKETPLAKAYTGEGILINSERFDGNSVSKGKKAIVNWLKEKKLADYKIHFRIRDWCISRQRYWGPPIPIIYCDDCGTVPVPEDALPVMLPKMGDYQPDGSGESPLKRDADFYHTVCPECGKTAVRETDVSDNFLCSSWYFYRYPSTESNDKIFDPAITKKWLPVDLYIGGNEHAVMHLLYSRFICMALNKIGLIDFNEPFRKYVANGMIRLNGAKMSKSKPNVIDPNPYIDRFGADALRTYLMFMGDYQDGGDFRDEGVKAMHGFIKRVWLHMLPEGTDERSALGSETLYWLHRTIKMVTVDIRRFSYHTAISRLMELLNHLSKHQVKNRDVSETFIKLLAPFSPHICEELWERWGHCESVFDQAWPNYSEEHVSRDEVEYVIQVNGKVRAKINLKRNLSEEEVEAAWRANPLVLKWTGDKTVIRQVFVPNRLMNIVVKR